MATASSWFSQEHRQEFERNGCAVIKNFLSAEEIAALRARTSVLLECFDPTDHPLTTFETGTRHDKHIGDKYFFDSSDKVSYFLDEEATLEGKLVVDKQRAVNKIGHGLHIREPLFARLTHSDRIREIAQKLGFEDPRVLQSMLIFKQPRIGGAVPMHQDSSFLFTRPLSACGFWIALEDCTVINGCLEVVPGSHKYSPVTRRFVRKQELITLSSGETVPSGTEFVLVDPAFSLFPPVRDNGQACPEPVSDAKQTDCQPLEVSAGSLVLIHGQLLHRSSHNHSEKSRWIYTFHIVEGMFEYDKHNWLQMPAGKELSRL
ncbi:hypothetical protein FB645_005081 [Coemansia sp. IMI 203386]|nr:hypothetical protein FB645_005081 [Coemansia sp. IMI 203386]